MAKPYFRRQIDKLIDEIMSDLPAVLIVGPRACGKTSTARRYANTIIQLDLEAEATAVKADPDGALDAPKPLLIDEWQMAPQVLGAVKRSVDTGSGAGRYLITGSVRSDLQEEGWPLTGRAIRVEMYGLTQREIVGKADTDPLLDRIAKRGVEAFAKSSSAQSLNDYLELVLQGGFPDAVLASSDRSRRRWLNAYVSQLVTRDAELIDSPRDPDRLHRFFHALCLNTAGIIDLKTMYEAAGINRKTATAYDRLLCNLFVIEEIPAWWTNRLKRLVKSPKKYVIDPGIAGAVLGLDPLGVRRDGDLLGRLLDTYVMSQIRPEVVVSESQPRLYHLRTEQGVHEVDIVIEYGDGRIFGLEIKAAAGPNNSDAKHLAWLRDELGDRFIGGAVLHTGPRTYPLGEKIVAAPISALWA